MPRVHGAPPAPQVVHALDANPALLSQLFQANPYARHAELASAESDGPEPPPLSRAPLSLDAILALEEEEERDPTLGDRDTGGSWGDAVEGAGAAYDAQRDATPSALNLPAGALTLDMQLVRSGAAGQGLAPAGPGSAPAGSGGIESWGDVELRGWLHAQVAEGTHVPLTYPSPYTLGGTEHDDALCAAAPHSAGGYPPTPQPVPPSVYERLLPADVVAMYEAAVLRCFLSESACWQPCSRPACPNAVHCLNPHGIDPHRASGRGGVAVFDVACACGQKFCWHCRREAHYPLPCGMLSAWQMACTELDEMDRGDVWSAPPPSPTSRPIGGQFPGSHLHLGPHPASHQPSGHPSGHPSHHPSHDASGAASPAAGMAFAPPALPPPMHPPMPALASSPSAATVVTIGVPSASAASNDDAPPLEERGRVPSASELPSMHMGGGAGGGAGAVVERRAREEEAASEDLRTCRRTVNALGRAIDGEASLRHQLRQLSAMLALCYDAPSRLAPKGGQLAAGRQRDATPPAESTELPLAAAAIAAGHRTVRAAHIAAHLLLTSLGPSAAAAAHPSLGRLSILERQLSFLLRHLSAIVNVPLPAYADADPAVPLPSTTEPASKRSSAAAELAPADGDSPSQLLSRCGGRRGLVLLQHAALLRDSLGSLVVLTAAADAKRAQLTRTLLALLRPHSSSDGAGSELGAESDGLASAEASGWVGASLGAAAGAIGSLTRGWIT